MDRYQNVLTLWPGFFCDTCSISVYSSVVNIAPWIILIVAVVTGTVVIIVFYFRFTRFAWIKFLRICDHDSVVCYRRQISLWGTCWYIYTVGRKSKPLPVWQQTVIRHANKAFFLLDLILTQAYNISNCCNEVMILRRNLLVVHTLTKTKVDSADFYEIELMRTVECLTWESITKAVVMYNCSWIYFFLHMWCYYKERGRTYIMAHPVDLISCFPTDNRAFCLHVCWFSSLSSHIFVIFLDITWKWCTD